MPEEGLNLLLCKIFKNDIKKADGTEYEPGTVTSFQRSPQHSNNNIYDEEKFELSREVLSSKHLQQLYFHLARAGLHYREESDLHK